MSETLQAKLLRERMEADAAGACCVCGLTLTARHDGTPYGPGVACIVTDNDGVKHFECWQGRESARGPILELTATELDDEAENGDGDGDGERPEPTYLPSK